MPPPPHPLHAHLDLSRFITALRAGKKQLSGYSDLRQCLQHPHAASSYASVPTSPAALARVRRVAFILFGHRCDTGDSEGATVPRRRGVVQHGIAYLTTSNSRYPEI